MSTERVCILDYGSGNVRSVFNLVSLLTKNVRVSNEVSVLHDATHLILPGVGAFGAFMEKIRERISLDVLEEEVLKKGKPFLGICVGMQVLADKGFEFGENTGLGWIPGTVERVDSAGLSLPHIGWNDIRAVVDCPLFRDFDSNWNFYFVHSYAFRPISQDHIAATVNYGFEFAAVVQRGNIFGVQFHPEKSQKAGRRLVENFLEIAG